MGDRLGTLVSGYYLVRCIAAEDRAVYYLSEQQYTYARAILKIFRTPATDGEADSFREEGRRLTTLFHPHLIRIFDVGIEASTAFLVMEYPPEGALRDQHPAGVVLPLEQVLPYVQQIADALHYLHDQGLAHGALRPEHLWMRRKDDLLVGDPLILSLAGSDAEPSSPYLAPEQAPGSASPASDQYSYQILWYTTSMPKRLTVQAHLSLEELTARYRAAKEAVERSH